MLRREKSRGQKQSARPGVGFGGFAALQPDREIALRCLMPEKFLERVREAEIAVRKATRGEENTLCMRVRGRDAQRLIALAERYSLKILSDKSVGADPLRFWKRLWPFAVGFLACGAALWVFAGSIWRIDVRCPQGGDVRTVRAALEQAGIAAGMAFPEEDPLARELESLCPGFAHISVRRDGVVLLVEAYRETDAPQLYDAGAARDLVAKYDAVIEEITVLSGRAAVQPGDVVKRGQVLIYGEERETDATTRGVSALGEVTGRIWAYAQAETSCAETIKVYTGRERARANLNLFDWTVSLREAEDFDRQDIEEEHIAVGGMFLPLHIARATLREYRLENKSAAPEVQKAALEAKTLADAMSQLPENAQMIDKWTDYSMMEGDWLLLRVCVQATLPIATARAQLDASWDTP